jgi:hypothetical protein
MYFTLDLKTMFETKFLGTFTIYLGTKFHMPGSNVSLVNVINTTTTYKFNAAVIFCFTLYKNNFITNFSKIYLHI